MKHDLSRLNSKEFENLSQALYMAECGIGTQIFGTGKDGGREATYIGEVNLEGVNGSWEGYCVLQAKYKEQIEDAKKNVEWLKRQIKSEVDNWESRGGRLPDYLVIATNIPLTAVSESGGVDQIDDYISALKESEGVPKKGWVVWHQESIHRLLDKNHGVRVAYNSWLLPGDVLESLIKRDKTRGDEVHKALRLYISKELQQQRFVNLDQAGSASDHQTSLSQVFFDPPCQSDDFRQSQTLASLLMMANRWSLKEAAAEPDPKNGNFVIIGGPGQGKSTVTQFMCQYYRADFLEQACVKESPLSYNVRSIVNEVKKASVREHLEKIVTTRLPVSIPLTQLADALARNEINSILGYLAKEIENRSDISLSVHDLRELISNVPILLVLDGLDEVPVSSNRNQVIHTVNDFLIEVAEAKADVFTVATTRPQGYTEEFSPEIYKHIELSMLATRQAISYGENLALVRHGDASDRVERLISRLKRAAEENTTSRLMTTPLQVTIMAVLLDRMGQAPKDRYSLFADYYRVIYERELEKESHSSQLLRNYRSDVRAIHADIGVLLQTKGESTGETYSSLTLEEVQEVVKQRLQAEGHEGRELDDLARKMITASTERLVFIVQLRANTFGFEIRSLQEFWASYGIVDGSDEEISNRINIIAFSSYWRNVLLFALGYIFLERKSLRDSVISILRSGDTQQGSDESRVLLQLGSVLAVDAIGDGLDGGPKYRNMFVSSALSSLRIAPCPSNSMIAKFLHEGDSKVQEAFLRDFFVRREGANLASLVLFLARRIELEDPNARTHLERILHDLDESVKFKLMETYTKLGEAATLLHFLDYLVVAPLSSLNKLDRSRFHGGNFAGFGEDLDHLEVAKNDFFRFVFTKHSNPFSGGLKIVIPDSGGTMFIRSVHETPDWIESEREVVPPGHWFEFAQIFLKQPSAASLGDLIEAFEAQSVINSEIDREFLTRRLPWPVGYAIIMMNEVTPEQVRNGYLGDLEDWESLEYSWANMDFFDIASGKFDDWLEGRSVFLPVSACQFSIMFDPTKMSEQEQGIKDLFCWIVESIDSTETGREKADRSALVLFHFFVGRSIRRMSRGSDDYVSSLEEFVADNHQTFVDLTRNYQKFSGSILAFPWAENLAEPARVVDLLQNELLLEDNVSVTLGNHWLEFYLDNPEYWRIGMELFGLAWVELEVEDFGIRFQSRWEASYEGVEMSPEKATFGLFQVRFGQRYSTLEIVECARYLFKQGYVSAEKLAADLPLGNHARFREVYIFLFDVFFSSDVAYGEFHNRLSSDVMSIPVGASFSDLRTINP